MQTRQSSPIGIFRTGARTITAADSLLSYLPDASLVPWLPVD